MYINDVYFYFFAKYKNIVNIHVTLLKILMRFKIQIGYQFEIKCTIVILLAMYLWYWKLCIPDNKFMQ